MKLVGRMLKDYPSEGTLRFNVEEFVDQAHMGSLLENLTHHSMLAVCFLLLLFLFFFGCVCPVRRYEKCTHATISYMHINIPYFCHCTCLLVNRDGIKFHPMEFAFLNKSVCKEGQGKDPKTKAYPPLAGPSIQQHFKLKDSHVTIHTSRAERLKKMAEQASPVIPSTASSLTSGSAVLSSGPAGPGSTSASASGPGAGSAGAAAASGASGIGGPPRPAKATSSGLFVRKQSGSSFLRTNAPRPMALPRSKSLYALSPGSSMRVCYIVSLALISSFHFWHI